MDVGRFLQVNVPSCLGVDGRHVAQAAVEAAPLEEQVLLCGGGERTRGAALQLRHQTEACGREESVRTRPGQS